MSRGLTLFEVAISLLVLSIAISAALLVFPVGMKTQQSTRYRLLAGSLVLQMQAEFMTFGVSDGAEGRNPADRPYVNSQIRSADIDSPAGMTFDFVPVPPAICARLASDREQLAGYLADGATLLYPRRAAGELDPTGRDKPVAPAVQRLVLCVIGYPQNNLLRQHPQLKGPYFDYYPMGFDRRIPTKGTFTLPMMATSERQLLEAALGSDATKVTAVPTSDAAGLTSLREVLVTLGVTFSSGDVISPATPPNDATLAGEYAADRMRFNARLAVLRYFAYACGTAAKAENGYSYGDESAYPDPTNAKVRAYQVAHGWMLAYYGWVARWKPYDQANPRDCQQAQAFNFPLIQFDPLATPLRDPTTSSGIMHCWPMLAGQPFQCAGNDSYYTSTAIGNFARSGSQPGWTATRPFAASERCRQVVVYAADWLQYSDAETVPSAPVDASMLPFLPTNNNAASWSAGNPQPVCHSYPQVFGPPERELCWLNSARNKRVLDLSRGEIEGDFHRRNTAAAYLGRFGADRNQNGVLDVGTLDTSVRLRATEIARFNLYDPLSFIQEH